MSGLKVTSRENLLRALPAEDIRKIKADRLTLLRPAPYDLLGLPPTKEDIDRFTDPARYGDTAGFEQAPLPADRMALSRLRHQIV